MILLYDTGARDSEILGLHPADIVTDKKAPYVYIRGKGRKIRTVPIMQKTVEHYQSYLKRFQIDPMDSDNTLFFTTVHGRRQKMSESYGKDCHQGMPGWEGGGHLMNVYDVFAMNTQSKNKEGAWDFLEFILSKKQQDSIKWAFPARTDSFNEYVERSYIGGTSVDERFVPGFSAEYAYANQVEEEDLAALREMVASSVYISGNARDAVGNIVYEEVAMFFNGGADLEQTIEKIQNRVSLYLKEM